MPHLIDEGTDDFGTQGDREQDAVDGPSKMGVVIDIVAASFCHNDGVDHEQACVDDGRHGDTIKIELFPGTKEDYGKEDGTYASGSSQAAIIIIIPPFDIRWNIGHDDSADVQYRVPVTL